MSGIFDIALKMEVMGAVLDCSPTAVPIAKKVHPTDDQKRTRLSNNLQTWSKGGTPRSGSYDQLDDLISTLHIEEKGPSWFIACTARELAVAVPEGLERQRALDKIRGSGGGPVPGPVGSVDIVGDPRQHMSGAEADVLRPQYILVHRPSVPSGVGLESGEFDQRHYWQSAGAAFAWDRVTAAQEYPTYDDCIHGLRAMVGWAQRGWRGSDAWRKAVTAVPLTTVIMLAGGGAPSKDVVVASSLVSLLEPHQLLSYRHIDVSTNMITTSVAVLEGELRRLGIAERVKLEMPLTHDVLLLAQLKPKLERIGPVLFGLTGGTLGNLRESSFFDSLGHIAASGDLLLISVDTLAMTEDSYKDVVRAKYTHPAMRWFLKPAIEAAVEFLGLGEQANWKEMLDRHLDVRLAGPTEAPHPSDVPESASIVLELNVPGYRSLRLLTSTRYQLASLTAFAGRWGWDCLDRVASPWNEHYYQLLFRRADKASDTLTAPGTQGQ